MICCITPFTFCSSCLKDALEAFDPHWWESQFSPSSHLCWSSAAVGRAECSGSYASICPQARLRPGWEPEASGETVTLLSMSCVSSPLRVHPSPFIRYTFIYECQWTGGRGYHARDFPQPSKSSDVCWLIELTGTFFVCTVILLQDKRQRLSILRLDFRCQPVAHTVLLFCPSTPFILFFDWGFLFHLFFPLQ